MFLDIPVGLAEELLEGPLNEFDNFIPNPCSSVSYVKQWNYNTMLKIDDKDFKASNPVFGVQFARFDGQRKVPDWSKYGPDKVIK